MVVNVDISTGVLYKAGPLINICMEHLGCNIQILRNLTKDDRMRLALQRFISGIKVVIRVAGTDRHSISTIKKISNTAANRTSFTLKGSGQSMTVASYFQQAQNRPLQYPDLPCVEVNLVNLYRLDDQILISCETRLAEAKL